MSLKSHAIKDLDFISNDTSYKFWATKPVRFKLWFINIHFYRMPVALGVKSLLGKRKSKSERWHLTWEEWEERIKKVCPFQFWLRKKFLCGIHGFFEYTLPRYTSYPYRSFKKKLTNPDNVIKLKDINVYADESTMILYSVFYLLCRYVEKKPEDKIYMDDTPQHKVWWDNVQKYYKYWKEERPALEKEIENSYPNWDILDPDTPYEVAYAKLNELEKRINDTDTEALKFIVETRENFWI